MRNKVFEISADGDFPILHNHFCLAHNIDTFKFFDFTQFDLWFVFDLVNIKYHTKIIYPIWTYRVSTQYKTHHLRLLRETNTPALQQIDTILPTRFQVFIDQANLISKQGKTIRSEYREEKLQQHLTVTFQCSFIRTFIFIRKFAEFLSCPRESGTQQAATIR